MSEFTKIHDAPLPQLLRWWNGVDPPLVELEQRFYDEVAYVLSNHRPNVSPRGESSSLVSFFVILVHVEGLVDLLRKSGGVLPDRFPFFHSDPVPFVPFVPFVPRRL